MRSWPGSRERAWHGTVRHRALIRLATLFGVAEGTRVAGRSDPTAWGEAVAAADARPMVYESVYARFRHGEALLAARGSREEAAAILARGRATAVQLGALPLIEAIDGLAARARLPLGEGVEEGPAIEQVPDPVAAYELTARELEVLRLVVAGPDQPADRRGAVHQREHSRRPRFADPCQVRCRRASRGGNDRRQAGPRRLTVELRVIGGCGAWPAAGEACSGYLLEHDGFRLLIDPGYAVLPRLLRFVSAEEVDAVFVSHRHPDHCADLNPLLRARALRDDPAPALPLFALPGALDAVLALDRPGMLNDAYEPARVRGRRRISDRAAGDPVGRPAAFGAERRRSNQGGASVLVYTGDAGPDAALVDLARDADVLLAEASYIDTSLTTTSRHCRAPGTPAARPLAAGVGRSC